MATPGFLDKNLKVLALFEMHFQFGENLLDFHMVLLNISICNQPASKINYF